MGQKIAIDDPIDFISQKIKLIKLAPTQTTSVAVNAGGNIEIGARIFKQDPLLGVAILIHEAHHSQAEDPGHVACLYGDIPKSSGGCDEKFSLERISGAYSYNVLFMIGLGLYGENLAKSDKEFLLSAAIAQLSNRFNQVPKNLGWPIEKIAVLTKDSQIKILSPFGKGVTNITPEPSLIRGIVEKIEYDPTRNGVIAISDRGEPWLWEPGREWQRLDADILYLPIRQMGRIFFSGEYNATFRFYVTLNRKIFYRDFDPYSGDVVLRPVAQNLADYGLETEEFVMAAGSLSLFIKKNPPVCIECIAKP